MPERRIEKTLSGLDGITSVSAVVDTKAVSVEWNEARITWDDIKGTLDKLGYSPEE